MHVKIQQLTRQSESTHRATSADAPKRLVSRAGNHTLRSQMRTKLTVGDAGDHSEHEANRIADQVMARSTTEPVTSAPPHIRRSVARSTRDVGAAPESVHQVLGNPGQALATPLRSDMEQRFQHDFSAVRVHTGPSAELSASDVNAQAYSVGSDIVFGAGRFAPGTHDGRRLIAHELAHVAQSGEAGPPTSQVVRRQPTNTNTPKNPDPNAPENRVGPLDTAQELGESGILFIPGPAAKPGEGLSIAGLRIPYRSFRLINPIEPRTVPQIPASTDDFADLVLNQFQPGHTLPRPGYPMKMLPRFVMDVSQGGVNVTLTDLIDLELFSNKVAFARRPVQGTSLDRPPTEDNSKTIGLVFPFLSVGRRLRLQTTIRIDDDYPEWYVDPTLIDLTLASERFSDMKVVRRGKQFVVDPLVHARATVFERVGYNVGASAHVEVNRLVGALVNSGIGRDQAVKIVDDLPAMFNELLASAKSLDTQQVLGLLSQIKSPADLRQMVRQLIARHLPADTDSKTVDRATEELVAEITHPGLTLTGSLILRLPGSGFERALRGLGFLEPRVYFSAATTRSVRGALAGDPFGFNFPYTFFSLGPTVIPAGQISEAPSPALGLSTSRYGETAGGSFSVAGRPFIQESGIPGLVGVAEIKGVKRIMGIDVGIEGSYKLESGGPAQKPKNLTEEEPFVTDYKTFQGSRYSGTRLREIPELQDRVEGVLSYPRSTNELQLKLTITKKW